MKVSWFRCAALMAGLAALLQLSGCGSSTTASALVPSRIISFGDNFSDVGQKNGYKYTVNDGTLNTWLEEFAKDYGLTVAPSNAGGTAYGRGGARVNSFTNVLGNTGTLSVSQQIDAFLATDSFGPNDLVFINGGVNDVIYEMNAVVGGVETQAQMQTNVQQAGADLAAQVKRLVNSGANYVVVMGTFNLGQTPWAASIGQQSLLTIMSSKFNEAMLVPIVTEGKHVLYVDATYYLNLVSNPLAAGAYGITNVTDPVCTDIDYGLGIGIGTGRVNSLNCTANTLISGVNAGAYAFADQVYFTPTVYRQFGDYAFGLVRVRW